MRFFSDPSSLTPDERLSEVAIILVTSVLRLHAQARLPVVVGTDTRVAVSLTQALSGSPNYRPNSGTAQREVLASPQIWHRSCLSRSQRRATWSGGGFGSANRRWRFFDGYDSLTVTQYSAHWPVDAQSPPANTAADPHSWSSPSLGPPNVSGRILPRHSAYRPQGWRFIDAYRHPNTLVAVGVWAGAFPAPQSPQHAFTLFGIRTKGINNRRIVFVAN